MRRRCSSSWRDSCRDTDSRSGSGSSPALACSSAAGLPVAPLRARALCDAATLAVFLCGAATLAVLWRTDWRVCLAVLLTVNDEVSPEAPCRPGSPRAPRMPHPPGLGSAEGVLAPLNLAGSTGAESRWRRPGASNVLSGWPGLAARGLILSCAGLPCSFLPVVSASAMGGGVVFAGRAVSLRSTWAFLTPNTTLKAGVLPAAVEASDQPLRDIACTASALSPRAR